VPVLNLNLQLAGGQLGLRFNLRALDLEQVLFISNLHVHVFGKPGEQFHAPSLKRLFTLRY
jgi:hypothetical protein